MPRTSPASPETEVEPSFEQAMEELETIVHLLESERLPLQELVGRYERGMTLLRVCQERLEHAQESISLITAGAGGRAAVVPFHGGAASASPATAPAPSGAARKPVFPPSAVPAADSTDDDEIRLF